MVRPKKTNLNEIIAISIIFIFIIVSIFINLGLYFKFNKPIVIDFKNLNSYKQLTEYDQFLIMARRFKDQHEYDINYYNCENYTNDLYDLSKQLGFKTERIMGCPIDNGTCHEWLRVAVDFEPQTGELMDYSLKYPLQSKI